MSCPEKYDVKLTDASGDSVGLVCDWTKGGAGLTIGKEDSLKSTAVSTKGNYGVRDSNDYNRIIQTDWVQGCGQGTYDREVDSESAYESSKSVYVGKAGQFSLGPAMVETADTSQLPAIIAHGNSGSSPYEPLIWSSFTDADVGDEENRIAWSKDGVTWTKLSGAGPGGSPVAFATDGATLYAVGSDGVVYTVTAAAATTFSASATNDDMTHIAFASGILYTAKGTATTDARLGSFSSAGPPVWTALTPAVAAAINADGATFGLVASGNAVYWGIAGNMVTKVFKAQYVDGAADILQAVATFPTGFVGASMYEYLGTVYVGGHFDAETHNTGIGTIYAITDDTPVLLTDIGTDPSVDNRVLAMTAYERALYFVSNSQLWRWDLVNGGYSHYAGPLNSTPTLSYSAITWDGEWTCDVAPGTGAEPDSTVSTSGTTSANIVGGAQLTINLESSGVAARQYRTTDVIAAFDDAVGETMEVEIPSQCIDDHGHQTFLSFGLQGTAHSAWVGVERAAGELPPLSHYIVSLWSGIRTHFFFVGSAVIGEMSDHTLRLTLKDGFAKLFDGTTLLVEGALALTGSETPEQVWIRGDRDGTGPTDDHVTFNNVRWTSDGAFDSDMVGTPVSGVALAAWRDRVIASCSGVGVAFTDPTSHFAQADDNVSAAYLLSSRSTGNMPTVDKYFHAIHVSVSQAVQSTSAIAVYGTIDGKWFTTNQDTALGDDNLLVFPIGVTGRNIQYQVNLVDTAGTCTPIVTEVAVLFRPTPKQTKLYTYYARVWDNVQDRLGGKWGEDAETVCDFIENNANTTVTVSRPRTDDFVGSIETVQFIEAPPSQQASGRQGLYELQIRRLS